MAELKTNPNEQNVEDFLNSVESTKKRQDSFAILKLMKEVTKVEPKMWGPSIVGFGNYHYKYESGREGDWFLTGFSPRKQNLTFYIMPGFSRYERLMRKLGKYKTGKACLYIKKLEDVDLAILRVLVEQSVEYLQENTSFELQRKEPSMEDLQQAKQKLRTLIIIMVIIIIPGSAPSTHLRLHPCVGWTLSRFLQPVWQPVF